MQLDESYEIFELTQHEGVVVSKARDKKTGKLIQIHLFPNEKIPEASQICARLLSLPGEARSKVLKYGQDGSSTYFITEPLPEGEGLAQWVLRQTAPRPESRLPEVNSGAIGNLRRMDIEPAPLQPLPAGQAQSPNPSPPVARSGPIVRPIPATTVPVEPSVSETGNFTRLYSHQDLKTPPQAAPPSQPPSPAPLPSSAGFTQIYGMQDWKFPESASNPDTASGAPRTTSGPSAGLETFIGIPKAMRPPTVPPQVAPREPATPAAPQAAPARPAYAPLPLPSSERFPPPPRGTRPEAETFAFDAPALQTPARQEAELFSHPASAAPVPAAPQPAVRPLSPTPQPHRGSAPLFSGTIAIAAAMGLMVLAAIVVLIVELSG